MYVPGWWSFAESALSRLTTPPDDVSASDRHVERVLTGSGLFALGRITSAIIGCAWEYSWLRAFSASIASEIPESRGARARMLAVLVAVAALTATMLRLLALVIART
jgi:hypothetical protein